MFQKEIVPPRSAAPASQERGGEAPIYRVALDLRGVGRREAGLDPSGEQRICYSVPLTGPVDDRWRRAFRLIQLEETGFFRYRLEMASSAITFVCRSSRSAGELEAGLRQLNVLIERVNGAASRMSY